MFTVDTNTSPYYLTAISNVAIEVDFSDGQTKSTSPQSMASIK